MSLLKKNSVCITRNSTSRMSLDMSKDDLYILGVGYNVILGRRKTPIFRNLYGASLNFYAFHGIRVVLPIFPEHALCTPSPDKIADLS